MTDQKMTREDLVIEVSNRRGGKSKYHRPGCKFERAAADVLRRECTLASLIGFHRIAEPAGCCKPTNALYL